MLTGKRVLSGAARSRFGLRGSCWRRLRRCESTCGSCGGRRSAGGQMEEEEEGNPLEDLPRRRRFHLLRISSIAQATSLTHSISNLEILDDDDFVIGILVADICYIHGKYRRWREYQVVGGDLSGKSASGLGLRAYSKECHCAEMRYRVPVSSEAIFLFYLLKARYGENPGRMGADVAPGRLTVVLCR
ncbi:hypothetical protein DFS34DRAFT_204728 [Phlyctochytrium arcticum]|nr:hypothetical protein DFS34DRAFT_204728 [Phlyctochytrium arcticum]